MSDLSDAFLTLATRLGSLEARIVALEQKLQEPIQQTEDAAQSLLEAVEAMKDAMSKNSAIAEQFLSFDIGEDGELKAMEQKVAGEDGNV
jgi:hypothetical protein